MFLIFFTYMQLSYDSVWNCHFHPVSVYAVMQNILCVSFCFKRWPKRCCSSGCQVIYCDGKLAVSVIRVLSLMFLLNLFETVNHKHAYLDIVVGYIFGPPKIFGMSSVVNDNGTWVTRGHMLSRRECRNISRRRLYDSAPYLWNVWCRRCCIVIFYYFFISSSFLFDTSV